MIKKTLTVAVAIGSLLAVPGMSAAHMPAGPAPETVPTENFIVEAGGCHANSQLHFVPEFGYRTRHFHRGGRCRAIENERYDDRDDFRCHSDPARHSHSGYGRTLHRHRGRDCRVRVLNRGGGGGGGRGGACIQIGPITYCE